MINPAHVSQAIRWRRHLHANPELAFEEVETGRFVAERLTEFGLGVTSNLAGTGVVGTLSEARPEGQLASGPTWTPFQSSRRRACDTRPGASEDARLWP
jgi:hypothetical protein